MSCLSRAQRDWMTRRPRSAAELVVVYSHRLVEMRKASGPKPYSPCR